MTSLMVLVGLFLTPPDWQTLRVPGLHNTARVVFSADGERVALCAQAQVSIVSRKDGSTERIDRPCAGFAFGPKQAYIATHYGEKDEPRVFTFDKTLQPLSPRRAFDLLWDRDRLLVAEQDAITVWQGSKQIATHPIAGVRRLVRVPRGILAVQQTVVLLLDDALAVAQTLTPSPKASHHGLYDAVEIADGAIVAIDNRGSLWRWDAQGALTRHRAVAASARALAWTGQHVVAETRWFDPLSLAVVAEDRRLDSVDGPVTRSPDGALIAHPTRGGVLLRKVAPPRDAPRGLPNGGRGMVMGPKGPVVADDDGALNWFDRAGRLIRRVYVARSQLRGLVGDPKVALYAGTEWGDVVVYRPGKPVERWEARTSETLALSKDGHTLLVGGQRAALRFDTRTGARTVLVETKDHHNFRPIFTPQGEVLVLCNDLPSRLWTADGTVVDWQSARMGAFDGRGRIWLAQSQPRAAIHAWPSGEVVETPGHYHWPDALIPLADGGMLGTDWSSQVVRFDAKGAERWVGRPPWHVGGAALDGRQLYTTGPDLGVWAWALETGERRRIAVPGRGEDVHGLVFSADSNRLAVAHDYGGVRIWQLDTHVIARELPIEKIADVRVERVGEDWLVRSGKTVQLWPDRANATPKSVPIKDADQIWIGSSTTSNGRFLFAASEPKGYVIDLMSGATVWRPTVPGSVRRGRVSADGKRVAMVVPKKDGTLAIQRQRQGGTPTVATPGEWNDLAWAGDALWAYGFKGTVLFKGGKPIRRLPDANWIRPPDRRGRHMIATNGAVAQVWTGTERGVSLAHGSQGDLQIAISPDGRWAATAGFNGAVTLWDARTGRAVAAYEAFSDGVWRSTDAQGKRKTGKTFARDW